MHDAAAALAGVAADMSASELQRFAQELNKQRAGINIARDLLAVHGH
jgi:stage V sporulation protein SpoVS